MLLRDFPPFTTVQGYFSTGTTTACSSGSISRFCCKPVRLPGGTRAHRPGQSVKTTESGGSRCYDAAKKVKGRKRHVVTHTSGLVAGAVIHPADDLQLGRWPQKIRKI
jgi:hypothetical protein